MHSPHGTIAQPAVFNVIPGNQETATYAVRRRLPALHAQSRSVNQVIGRDAQCESG
jgi:hypothetical protein